MSFSPAANRLVSNLRPGDPSKNSPRRFRRTKNVKPCSTDLKKNFLSCPGQEMKLSSSRPPLDIIYKKFIFKSREKVTL